jgi:hypothetical protein
MMDAPDVSAEILETQRPFAYRTDRVKDDDLRASLEAIIRRAAEIQVERAVYHKDVTEQSLFAEEADLTQAYVAVQKKLGAKLREYL